MVIVFLLSGINFFAQELDSLSQETPPYFRKEEIIHDLKRYGIHNNYLTIGFGFASSTIRESMQSVLGIDYQFHIRLQHFQTGAFMSGNEFGSDNHIQLHVAYGYRKELVGANFAAFVGPAYFTGVEGDINTGPLYYDGFGAHLSVQAVKKFWYDIGLGVELFGDINYNQTMIGIKIIAFFSNAYKGPKKNINPNVRAENPGM